MSSTLRGLLSLNAAKALTMAMMVGGIGGAAAYNRVHLDGRADHVDAKVAHIDRQTARVDAKAAHVDRQADVATDAAAVTLSTGPLAQERTLENKVAKIYKGVQWMQGEINGLGQEVQELKAEVAALKREKAKR